MRGFMVMVVMVGGGCSSPSAKIDAPLPGSDAHEFHDAAIDAPPDAPLGPCTLGSLSLAATTLAGCGEPGTMNGVRDVVRFDNPVNVALDTSGIAYVPDFDSNRLRRVDTTGATTTIVNVPQFRRPFGIIMTPGGFMYVETDDNDTMQHGANTGTLWKITPAGQATVILANHGRPRGLALLSDGRIATSDYIHNVIEIIDPALATATLVAGTLDVAGHDNLTGAAATFAQPWDLVVDTASGDLIVAEHDNNVLRRVTLAGVVTDFAGTGVPGHLDGPVATAQFFHPKGITKDASGALYITEEGNHDIRKIASGMVTTVAGMAGVGGFADNADPLLAQFQGVEGLDVSADGKRIVIADGNNGDGSSFNRIRVVTLP